MIKCYRSKNEIGMPTDEDMTLINKHTLKALTKDERRNFFQSKYDYYKQFNNRIDTCYITDQGDMIFSRIGELNSQEEAQKFVDDNHVRFSVSFGPILVDNGQRVEPERYHLGEIDENYARAGLGQLGQRHYLLATANTGDGYRNVPDIHQFANNMHKAGCIKAYALDGGQTAVIAMNDQLINKVVYGYQRKISDIIYFATAVPETP